MCKVLCSLTLILLSLNNVLTWDIALTIENKIQFYTNGDITRTEHFALKELTAMTYDAASNVLYFVDQEADGASIFSYNVDSKKFEEIVKGAPGSTIQGLTFDPVSRTLFWTDSVEKTISWASLEIGNNKTRHKNVLLTMAESIPAGITVDSCRGYIYWTNMNISKATIERARFNGTEREMIIETDIFKPVSISIDQRTKTLYWADDKEGIHFEIQSSDLDGKNRKIVYKGIHHQPSSLSVSNNSIYWIDSSHNSVSKIDKNKPKEPQSIVDFTENPFNVVAYYNIKDQIKDIPECLAVNSLSYNTSSFNTSYATQLNYDLYCLNGDKVNNTKSCKCWPGYTGKRCEVFLCHNYCLHGDCLMRSGRPECSCKQGFTGIRCETVNLCNDYYCLNDGVCSVEENRPICTCSEKFEGTRCEFMRIVPSTTSEELNSTNERKATLNPEIPQTVSTTEPHQEQDTNTPVTDTTTEANKQNDTISFKVLQTDLFDRKEIEKLCANDWDPIRDSVIMALALLCVIMCGTSTLLFKKILHLKRRPRIKKRIIVNKNVTPLTARPDQCEITIEDCCNMNICETPCFEPRTSIRPTLTNSKIGKEDRINLIGNMEHPDDLF